MEKFNFYSGRALEAIDKSIAASPGRVPIYFQKAQIYLTRGEKDKGIETLKHAYDLNPIYYDSACHLGKTLLYFKDEEGGYKYMDKCIDLGGIRLFNSASMIKGLINHYIEKSDGEKIISLYEQLVKLEPKNAKVWINLAIIYSDRGDKEKAIEAAEKAIEADSSLKQYAEEFIAKIE
jgi:tetratricopeptide (TPR) repeat protein